MPSKRQSSAMKPPSVHFPQVWQRNSPLTPNSWKKQDVDRERQASRIQMDRQPSIIPAGKSLHRTFSCHSAAVCQLSPLSGDCLLRCTGTCLHSEPWLLSVLQLTGFHRSQVWWLILSVNLTGLRLLLEVMNTVLFLFCLF